MTHLLFVLFFNLFVLFSFLFLINMHLLDLFNRCCVDRSQVMDFPVDPTMAAAYKYKAELLLKEYLLADSYALYTSVLGGLLMCKLVL